ncbi:LOW QUALITY PROTEIN: pectinesterase-like [Macadamia integrifolia]|uniref:LOW QUALITY PROTEIN: pectinesterase-like n=1 Tax=Macadamia integrifolia TaxID=60698 RepID=UPI001C4EA623|nr:LOW QUALITY PROTEIN: pectinesterase-like [Macadamia integrifolia]
MDDKLFVRVLVSLSLLALVSRVTNGDSTESSCSQTPYPQICNSFITSNPLVPSKGFHDVVITVTMNQAQLAHDHISAMDLTSFDEPAKAAWADCAELYNDTISQLNRVLLSNSWEDTQTWLSAAVANHQTCQNGFLELKKASFMSSLPSMLSDFSKLLSNSLAVNKQAASAQSSKPGGARRLLSDGFPSWVSGADRKLLQSTTTASQANIVVAADGSGNYKTITEALAASSKLRSGTSIFVIYVKKGTYQENVEITKSMKNIMLIGDGIDATIVTGSKNVQDGSTTFRSATVAAVGDGFIAKAMTFQNTAGPQKHQAVAFRSGSDLSVFYQCSFKGYQDTLYVYSQRQFYRNCDIYGTVDFIFGDAAVVFQNCNIYVRKPMSNQKNTVTAQGRSDPNENTGISIHDCTITAASDLKAVQSSFKTYLGRPWKEYSRTVVMKTSLDSLIDPAGWLEWSGNFALSTLYYGEYANTGSGSSTSGRVKWTGYHIMIMSTSDAQKFTVANFLGGGSWIGAAGVPYTSGL